MADRQRTWWLSSNGLLLIAGMISSLCAWLLIASPVAMLGNVASHAGHFDLVYVHMLGGTVAAVMAYRAVRNGRYDSHRDWMIRSYVLAWSFVFCRIVSRVPAVGELGDGQAFIWLSWVGPVLLCEAALQWRAGSRHRV